MPAADADRSVSTSAGRRLLAGVVDASGTVLARERRHHLGAPAGRAAATSCRARSPRCARPFRAAVPAPVGFGIPALIDRRSGDAVRCVHLPLDGVDFGARIAPLSGPRSRSTTTRTARCSPSGGSARRAARRTRRCSRWGPGSAAASCSTAASTGAAGRAAELGHVPVDLNGPPCFGGCPGAGAWRRCARARRWPATRSRSPETVPGSRLGRDLAAGRGHHGRAGDGARPAGGPGRARTAGSGSGSRWASGWRRSRCRSTRR